MTLREFLDTEKISPSVFAVKIGVTPVALYRYMAGDRQPRRAVVQRIIEQSDGKVTPGDLFVVKAAA